MPESEWVRVRQPETGHHITLSRVAADAAGLSPLKQDAVNANGDPRPPKYRVDKGSPRTETADPATKKES